jgi:protein-S-isoprenylcysteine O-methyltransferase Ste14
VTFAATRPAFVASPTYSFLLTATLLIWAALELRQALNRRAGAQNQDRGSLMVVRAVSVAAAVVAALVAGAGAARFPVTAPVFWVALAAIWAGIALRQWCFITLGRYFTFTVKTSPDQRVISAGPYRVLRHPSYSAILLILAGIGLTYGNWLSLAALVAIPAAGLVYRIHVEEAALSAAIGAEYTDFVRSRKRLIPFVW